MQEDLPLAIVTDCVVFTVYQHLKGHVAFLMSTFKKCHVFIVFLHLKGHLFTSSTSSNDFLYQCLKGHMFALYRHLKATQRSITGKLVHQ